MTIEVQFSRNRKLKDLSNKRVPLREVNRLLGKADEWAERQQKPITTTVTIMQEEKVLFKDVIIFGKGQSRNILSIVKRSLNEVFIEVAESEKQRLLTALEVELNQGSDGEVDSVVSIEPMVVEQVATVPPEKPKKPDKARPVKIKQKLHLTFPKAKKLVLAGGFILLFLFASVGFYVYATNQPVQSEDFIIDTMLSKGSYQEIADTYPKRVNEVEEYLFQEAQVSPEDSLEALESFVDKNDTTFGELDVALLSGDYSAAVEWTEENDIGLVTNSVRLASLGYAFLKEGQLEEAKQMSVQSKNIELEKYITQYEQYQRQIELLEQEISELEVDALKNKTVLEEKINELYDIKAAQAAL